jgi:general secretion pathway protein I
MKGGNGGFTLLEMMVATVIMGIAVVGLLSGISTSLRNAAGLTDHDRAVLLARTKLDELLLDRKFPKGTLVEGKFDEAIEGGVEGGWRARLVPFDVPPGAGPGTVVLERMQLEIWWMSGGARRTFTLDGYRPGVFVPEEAAPAPEAQ